MAGPEGSDFIAVSLVYRPGRHPISHTEIRATGEIEITGADGRVEVIGSHAVPPTEEMIRRIRSAEGMMLVEMGEDEAGGFDVASGAGPRTEQMLKDRYAPQH